jgi:hypothetical protein
MADSTAIIVIGRVNMIILPVWDLFLVKFTEKTDKGFWNNRQVGKSNSAFILSIFQPILIVNPMPYFPKGSLYIPLRRIINNWPGLSQWRFS